MPDSITLADGTALDTFEQATNAAITALQTAVAALQAGTGIVIPPAGSGGGSAAINFTVVSGPPTALAVGAASPSVNVSVSPALEIAATANFYWTAASPTAEPSSGAMAGTIFNNQSNIACYPALPASAGTYYLSVWLSTGGSFVFPAVTVTAPSTGTGSGSGSGTGTGTGGGTGSGTGTTTSATMTITQASLSANQLWLHGPWASDLWKQYDYTLDGGATWTPAGGFGGSDGGTYDTWVYNLTVAPGTYNVGMRDHNDTSNVVMFGTPLVVTPNTAPASVVWSGLAINSSVPNGTPVGTLAASGGTPKFALTLGGYTPPPGIGVSGPNNGVWNFYVADQTQLVAGTTTQSGSVMSGTLGVGFSFSLAIAAGTRLPASDFVFTPVSTLSEGTVIGNPAFTVGIAGQTGGTFSILQQQVMADPSQGVNARYTLAGTTASTSNTLAAQSAEPITLVYTNASATCVYEGAIAVASVPDLAAVEAADTGSFSGAMASFQTDPWGKYAGAVCEVAPGLAITKGWLMPGAADGWNDNGFWGPQTLRGKPGTVAAPNVMPVITFPSTNWGVNNNQGWLEVFNGRAKIQGLEFANMAESYPGEVGNFCGIVLNGGSIGQLIAQYLFIHNVTDGIRGGHPGQLAQILDCEIAKCGGGDGYTHNIYIAAIAELLVERIFSYEANEGHCLKTRAAKSTIMNSVFADLDIGCASYQIDIPDNGDAVVSGCILQKGQYAENSPFIHYGDENENLHPVNTLLVENNIFINNCPAGRMASGGYGVNPVGVRVGSCKTGPSTAVIQNNTFYGMTADQLFNTDSWLGNNITQSGNVFLPLSEAPTVIPAARPFAAGGYSTLTTTLAAYLAGPQAGK